MPDRATISARDFWGADRETQRHLIPARPGVYVWTLNIAELIGRDELAIEDRLSRLLNVVGQPRQSKVGPYFSVSVQDSRKVIAQPKRLLLHKRLNAGDDFGQWIAGIATEIQRPLYVGMATNLYKRIYDHLRGRTKLAGYMQSAGGDPMSLAVTWLAAPSTLTRGPSADEALDTEPDGAGRIVDDLTPEEEDPPLDPELDAWLKATESLLIRLAMPMLNEKQD